MRQTEGVAQTMRRASYHHGDLANALADAAIDLARTGGPEAVVLREAARHVGVSPTAAYRHFASHADLIHEIKLRCQGTLASYMDGELAASAQTGDRQTDAVNRLRALGLGYLRFAIAEPGLFRTAFCHDSAEAPTMEAWDSPAFAKLAAVLDELTELGLIKPELRPLAEVFPWATVHGLATLLVDGPIAGLPEELREAALQRTLTSVVDGLLQRPWPRADS